MSLQKAAFTVTACVSLWSAVSYSGVIADEQVCDADNPGACTTSFFADDSLEDNAPRPPTRPGDSEWHSTAPPVLPGDGPYTQHGLLGRFPNGSLMMRLSKWPKNGLSTAKTREAHRGFCFNCLRSDTLPLDRTLPDFRSPACRSKHKQYPNDLPTATIVMVFHNECFSALMRSVHSVLNHSPPRLVSQVILVDDSSSPSEGRFDKKHWDRLQNELTEYCQSLPKVLLVRLAERRGLMLARMEGVWRATGDVVIFLDSHIEAGTGWIEPLLARIAENRTRLVVPAIDSIDAENFSPSQRGLGVLSFSWKLGQVPGHSWYGSDRAQPAMSAIMPGGLFAADRKSFLKLGGYDPDMRLYGGEEMEISFRTWMCGGSIESLPCSHVGHIFRTNQYWQGQVYVVPGQEIHRNKLRAAHVWMDSYKRFVEYASEPMPMSFIGNLTARKALRKRLKCKSFNWYLNRVATDVMVPPVAKNTTFGALASVATYPPQCMDTLGKGDRTEGEQLGMYGCHGQHGAQSFVLDKHNLMRIPVLGYAKCTARSGERIVIRTCEEENESMKWHWDKKSLQLISKADGKCLQAQTKDGVSYQFRFKTCNEGREQQWKWG